MIRFICSWVLYWLGDMFSKVPYSLGTYPVYNFLMLTSEKVQGKGKGPWK